MNRSVILATLCLLASSALAQHRPLALHPDNPRYLVFRGKPAVLITSGEHYGAVLNGDFDFKAYLDELAADGLNLTRTFSGTYFEVGASFGITENTLAPRREAYIGPWIRSDLPGAKDGGNKFDLTKFNEAYFTRLKEFIAEASKRGIVVEYVLFCPFYDDKLWAVNAMNVANNVNGIGQMKREEVYTLGHKEMLDVHLAFVRKAVAELNSFDNVYFEICNEPYFGGVREDWQARIAAEIVATEKNLPNKHLIAQNIANGSKKVEKPDPNVSIFNYHYATPPDVVEQNVHLNRPIGDDETGFKGSADVTYRSEGWDFLIAGGAIYSSLDYSFSVKHPAGTLRDYRSPGGGSKELRQQLGIAKKFIESFEFMKMKPMNGVVKGGSVQVDLKGTPAKAQASVRVLGEAGKQYIVYIRGGRGAELQLDLPAGKYRAEWLNTRTGKIEANEFDHAGGVAKIVSGAFEDDAVLGIRSAR